MPHPHVPSLQLDPGYATGRGFVRAGDFVRSGRFVRFRRHSVRSVVVRRVTMHTGPGTACGDLGGKLYVQPDQQHVTPIAVTMSPLPRTLSRCQTWLLLSTWHAVDGPLQLLH